MALAVVGVILRYVARTSSTSLTGVPIHLTFARDWGSDLTAFAAPLPSYLAVMVLTRPGVAPGAIDEWVLRSRSLQLLGQISMAFYLLQVVPFTIVAIFIFPVSPGQVSPSRIVAQLVALILLFPAAWLLTHYFEQPVGRQIVRVLRARQPPAVGTVRWQDQPQHATVRGAHGLASLSSGRVRRPSTWWASSTATASST